SRSRHTRFSRDVSSDVCSSDLTRSEYAIIVRGATGIEDVISCMYYFVPNTAVLFILTSNPPRPWDKINNLFPNAILVNLSPPKRSEERRVGKECISWCSLY